MQLRRDLVLFWAGLIGLVALVVVSSSGVSFAQGKGKGPDDVRVVNAPNQPVPVSVVDPANIEPVAVNLATTIPADAMNNLSGLWTVPEGKRLVIESLSLFAYGYEPGMRMQVKLVINGIPCFVDCSPSPTDMVHYLTRTMAFKAHVAAGGVCYVDASRWPTGASVNVQVNVFGYYVATP